MLDLQDGPTLLVGHSHGGMNIRETKTASISISTQPPYNFAADLPKDEAAFLAKAQVFADIIEKAAEAEGKQSSRKR